MQIVALATDSQSSVCVTVPQACEEQAQVIVLKRNLDENKTNCVNAPYRGGGVIMVILCENEKWEKLFREVLVDIFFVLTYILISMGWIKRIQTCAFHGD